ncbi:uncharacterized protein LOC119684464 [Teleopsis dalmanni]|uniref:uncharacterized protein LOC119684464 n=1 Tax=Teleopsis dalmanni TaxID=139649 RepID=UPI0018CFECF0|nr:uncharacterized protein LOC119684464 [Teleopsis dalmanni]
MKKKQGRPRLDLSAEEKKERHKLQQKIWRENNRAKIRSDNRRRKIQKMLTRETKIRKYESLVQLRETHTSTPDLKKNTVTNSEFGSFTSNEIKLLADQMRSRKTIWFDIKDANISEFNITMAWLEVSAACRKSVEECKHVWTRLCGTYYLQSKFSATGENEENDLLAWEFDSYLNFLPNPVYEESCTTLNDSQTGKYSVANSEEDTSEYDLPQNTTDNAGLKYYDMWANFDRMLHHLPWHEVEKVNEEVMSLICKKVMKYNEDINKDFVKEEYIED